jgi:cytochrome c oxidase subunit 2
MQALSDALHSSTQPLGVHAQHIDKLWQAMLWTCTVMYVLVLAFLVLAILRRNRAPGPDMREDRRLSVTLGVWIVLIVTGLFGLTVASFFTDRALVRAAAEPEVSLQVTAHQWWWEIEYLDADPSRQVRTANEIHLPVDAQVHIALASNDVIHSFWVPNLHGKQDLIPGRPAQIRLQPRQVGTFRGPCAEFCGVQHANMALEVVVESRADYDAWYEKQLATARAPASQLESRGQQVFMSAACNLCHAISGTDASATVAPDLSHVASRRMIAAGTLPNDKARMIDWLANPQHVKPGNRMPRVELSDADRDALVAYMVSLQ